MKLLRYFALKVVSLGVVGFCCDDALPRKHIITHNIQIIWETCIHQVILLRKIAATSHQSNRKYVWKCIFHFYLLLVTASIKHNCAWKNTSNEIVNDTVQQHLMQKEIKFSWLENITSFINVVQPLKYNYVYINDIYR